MKKTILIVGAGAAGLSAAYEAARKHCDVKLISSQPSERAQSVMAEGGINAALNTKGEEDSPSQHYEDTIKAGCGLADPNAVRNLTEAAPHIVRKLHDLGVQFNMDEYNEIDLRNFGGQKKKRTAFAQSDTGKQLMTALIDAVRKEEAGGAVERFSHHSFQTLLLREGICSGCVIRDIYTGEIKRLSGDAVIIASGGLQGLFGETTGSLDNTGEVSAELFRLGVPMANLEMIQFHPTTVPVGGRRLLISEAARAEGGRLFAYRNGTPWYFMEEKYPELGNLMPRDVTAREIWKVSRESEVFLDMTGIPEETVEKKLSGLLDDCLTYLGKDFRKEAIPVSPGIHYFMGGIYVDECHRTALPGLYAAGECCAQYHGANRLGGNSLLGAVYGGRKAARTAFEDLKEIKEPKSGQTSQKIFSGTLPEKSDFESSRFCPGEKKKLNRILLDALGVVRNEKDLKKGLEQALAIDGSPALLGQAVIMCALERRESRGAHFREDYPARDDANFKKTTVAKYDGEKIRISFEPIPERRQ